MVETEEVKIILIGDASVGKSCIVQQYVTGTFQESTKATVGAAFISKDVELEGHSYTLNIWDTAGQEAYRYLVPMYYRGASIGIIVFDITKRESYDSVSVWLSDAKKEVGENLLLVLCGNKCDLDIDRQVTFDEAMEYATENDLLYTETSALSGSGIGKLFEMSLLEFQKRNATDNVVEDPTKNVVSLGTNKEKTKKSRKC